MTFSLLLLADVLVSQRHSPTSAGSLSASKVGRHQMPRIADSMPQQAGRPEITADTSCLAGPQFAGRPTDAALDFNGDAAPTSGSRDHAGSLFEQARLERIISRLDQVQKEVHCGPKVWAFPRFCSIRKLAFASTFHSSNARQPRVSPGPAGLGRALPTTFTAAAAAAATGLPVSPSAAVPCRHAAPPLAVFLLQAASTPLLAVIAARRTPVSRTAQAVWAGTACKTAAHCTRCRRQPNGRQSAAHPWTVRRQLPHVLAIPQQPFAARRSMQHGPAWHPPTKSSWRRQAPASQQQQRRQCGQMRRLLSALQCRRQRGSS